METVKPEEQDVLDFLIAEHDDWNGQWEWCTQNLRIAINEIKHLRAELAAATEDLRKARYQAERNEGERDDARSHVEQRLTEIRVVRAELATMKAEKKSLEVESLCAYIDLLKADNERLREAGKAALEYMDECECYWPDGSPDQGFIPIPRPCPHRQMERALNPEPKP